MYPSQAFLNDYIYDDLPDQVIAGGVTLSKQDGGGQFGYYYTDGQNTIQFASYWLLSGPLTDYKTFESSCLISKYINIPFDEFDPVLPPILVEDQFADNYIIEGFPFAGTIEQYPLSPPFSVNRITFCRWEKTVDGTLYFGNPDFPPASGKWTSIIELYEYYFQIFLIWVNNDPNDFYYPPTQVWNYTKLGPPSEPNSSPSGTYSGEGGGGTHDLFAH